MKILLVNQFFWPDTSATSQLLTDLSRALPESGHEVTVICAAKEGEVYTELEDPPPVRIVRVKTRRFARGTGGRILSYLSFSIGAAFAALTLPRQDLSLTLTTPPLLPLLGSLLKRVRGSRHFIWEMDIYPDVAVDLGYFKRGGVLDRVVGMLADYSRRRSDGIIALGECMLDRLEDRAERTNKTWLNKIWVAHNWADGKSIVPRPHNQSSDRPTILYSGNIGLAHDFSTVLGAIKALGETAPFDFHFRGNGARLSELSDFIDESRLSTISLGAFVARGSLSDSLGACDIGLVTQREICCGSVVPSKLYGMLAAGKPILFIGPRDATPARILDEFACGWTIIPGDVNGLTALLLHLAEHREEVTAAGVRARQTLLDHFDSPKGIARIVSVLESKASLNKPVYAAQAAQLITNDLEPIC